MKKLILSLLLAAGLIGSAAAQVPTNGLVDYYNFNNGSTNDSSPSRNNLILNGASFTTDRFGNPNCALRVNLTNGAIQQNNIGISGKAPRTISVWVNPTSIPVWNSGRIVDWGSGTYGWCNIQYCNRVNKTIYLTSNNLVWDGGFSLSGVTSSPSDLSQRWRNIVMTYNGTNALFYIDGVIQSRQASTSSFPSINTVNTPMKVNGYPLGITGSIDDVRIYNRALSATEVSALYNQEKTPPLTVCKTELYSDYDITLSPGIWQGYAIAASDPYVYYSAKITPTASSSWDGACIEKYEIQSEYNGSNKVWNDVLRVNISANAPRSLPVHVRIFKTYTTLQ